MEGGVVVEVVFTVNTGATAQCIDYNFLKKIAGVGVKVVKATPIGLVAASGARLKEKGKVNLRVGM
jgi:hypothetical protein